MSDETPQTGTGVLLAKIRSTDRLLGASGRVGVEPLRATVPGTERSRLGLDGRPQWFSVQTEPDASPWDQAHARVADQLGIDEDDVLFVEPDLANGIYRSADDGPVDEGFAVGSDCNPVAQDSRSGKAVGNGFAWHLDGSHTGLTRARAAVDFTAPRTRVAHIDTGYSRVHETTPTNVARHLERNFVRSDGNLTSAVDPDNDRRIMDNSGHGTGTLSILAGGPVVSQGEGELGGAPGAEIVPIRISDRVVLFRTSALARAILYAGDIGCAVASLSMGGQPSKAWAEAVDEAYDAGLCLIAAGGNRIGELPPRSIVYPARYPRVIAVTGVMADGNAYEDLDGKTLEGSFGPDSAMEGAIAAYTPNIPWAKFGCPDITRLNGEGTSAATPQVAAAAALWIEKYKEDLPSDWRRVEAVRFALFSKAKIRSKRDRFGAGILQANRSLSVLPHLGLPRSDRSRHRFAALRVLTGFFVEEETPREEMFELELAQLWLTIPALGEILDDPNVDEPVSEATYKQLLDIIIEDRTTSDALRRHLLSRYSGVTRTRPPSRRPDLAEAHAGKVVQADPPAPSTRRVRIFAKDPTLATSFETTSIGEVTLEIPWEPVAASSNGFQGEYVEVIDDAVEPIEGRDATAPSLDHPNLLAQDGWTPSPANVHFHQQMVYGVAMKTIEHFERALGRPVQWRPGIVKDDRSDDSQFVPRLALRPHALEAANAYYSPSEVAVLFGYFAPESTDSDLPGLPVYTCLSYDIIAHETTHAIIDGLYRRFSEPTNVDVLAFHEAFSDLVALLQSFDLTGIVEHEIQNSRGDLQADTVFGKLAVQFGAAARGREALRSAIGRTEGGSWVRSVPDPTELRRQTSPHRRGAILVSAVFDALIAIYESRTADLFRIATGGTGRLPDGAIHPDLATRLASEAAKSARHLLRICIRALDYLPPVDITFLDFLRALVTADYEFVPDDPYHYRVAIIEAFAKRGIGPTGRGQAGALLGSASAEPLIWPGFRSADASGVKGEHYTAMVEALVDYAEDCRYIQDREVLFDKTRHHRAKLHGILNSSFKKTPSFRSSLGLEPGRFEVHALRRAMRARPNGRVEPEVIVSLIQSKTVPAGEVAGAPRHTRLGGATLIVNLTEPDLPRYRILKSMDDEIRNRTAADFAAANEADPLRALYLAPKTDQFAALHQVGDRP